MAERLGLPYSTAHRYVSTVVQLGYLESAQGTGTYRVGLPVIELAGVALNQLEVYRHATPYLDRLADATRLDANLSVLYHGDILHLAYAVRSQSQIRSHSVIGRRTPAHLTAMGKTMLADMYFGDVRKLIEHHGWRPRTPNSINSYVELEKELERVRLQGYALDREEQRLATRCVAAPIRGRTGRVVAALSVSGSASAIMDGRIPGLVSEVQRYAAMISQHLGYRELL